MDVFLAHHFDDAELARGLADDLAGWRLLVGSGLEIWPQMRLLPRVDQGLIHARFCVVVVSPALLRLSLGTKDLDGLARRRKVVALLRGVGEAEVADQSRRLAVAAVDCGIPALVRLLRDGAAETG